MIIRAIINIIFISFNWLNLTLNKIKILLIIKIKDAIACLKKYLIDASVELELNLLIIRGIIIIRFNSSPSQLINQDDEEIAIIVPNISKKINVIW